MNNINNNKSFEVKPVQMGKYGIIGSIVFKGDNFDCYVDPDPATDNINFTNIEDVKKLKHRIENNTYPEECNTSIEQNDYAKSMFEIFARPILAEYYNKLGM